MRFIETHIDLLMILAFMLLVGFIFYIIIAVKPVGWWVYISLLSIYIILGGVLIKMRLHSEYINNIYEEEFKSARDKFRDSCQDPQSGDRAE